MLRRLLVLVVCSIACVQVSVDEPPRPRADSRAGSAPPPPELPSAAQPEAVAGTVASFAVREPVAAVPDAVTLEHAGSEPRELLTVGGTLGERRTLELELGLSAAMQIDAREVPPTAVPALRVVLDAELVEHDADHTAIAIDVTDVVLPAEASASARVQQAIESTAAELRASKGRIVLASDGRIRAFELAAASDTPRAAGLAPELGGLVAALQELLPVLPSTPVGNGARWRSVQHVRRDAITLQQVAQWTATRGADGAFELRASSEHTMLVAEQPITIEAASGHSSTHVVWARDRALPLRAEGDVSTITRANLQLGSERQRVSMDVELSLRLAEVAR